jgi:hypothetical protein
VNTVGVIVGVVVELVVGVVVGQSASLKDPGKIRNQRNMMFIAVEQLNLCGKMQPGRYFRHAGERVHSLPLHCLQWKVIFYSKAD